MMKEGLVYGVKFEGGCCVVVYVDVVVLVGILVMGYFGFIL